MKNVIRRLGFQRRLTFGLLAAATLAGDICARAIEAAPSASVQNLPASAAQFSPGINDILRMVDAKVDPAVIQSYVRNSTVPYSPTAAEIIALKDHAVSSDVITALLQRGGELRAQAASTARAVVAAAPPPGSAPTYAAAPAYNAEPTYVTQPAYAYDSPVYSYGYPVYSYSYPYYVGGWYGWGWPYYWPWYSWGGSYYHCGYRYPYCHSGYNHYGHWGNYYGGHSGGHGWSRPTYSTGVGTHGYGTRPGSFAGHSGSARPAGGFSRGSVSFASHTTGMQTASGFSRRPASFASSGSSFRSGGGFGGGRPASFASSGGGFRSGGGFGGGRSGGHR